MQGLPTTDSTRISGSKMGLGVCTTRVKTRMPLSPNTRRKTLASASEPTVNQNRCGVSIISIGPGFRPWMLMAPMITAVTASPGMPRVIIGT